ncbi:MAG: glycosyltransferase family 2 protein [Desulfobacterales bacterium]|nr:glycosyltransferase family 2 protein [Desulfobacterales bacterium]
MSPANVNYVVITPVRDEEEHVEGTILSVLGQTIRPKEWLIVNDGSTDGSGAILDKYAAQHDWITAVHVKDRGYRADGGGVHAFYEGFDRMRTKDWQFLANLDSDMVLEPDYYERCFQKFEQEPKLGLGGGVIYNRRENGLELEELPLFHVRGATKIYGRECWDAMGGLYQRNGWDTLDEVKCNMLGWTSRSFPDVHLIQERFTGDGLGQWSNWVKNGRASYVVGYHPLFFLAKTLAKVKSMPIGVASLGLLRGYLGALLSGTKTIEDTELIRYLRDQQFRRLVGKPTMWR